MGDENPSYRFRKSLEAVKAAVPIEQVAAEYGEFKLLGNGRLLGRCIAPDHTDRTPSLTIYTDSQRFRCYGCGLRGDVIDFERVANKHVEAWTAMRALADRYGVELPQWSRGQHRRQERQKPVRDALEEVKTRSVQRRLMRILEPFVARIEDDDERQREARAIWSELDDVARVMVRTLS